MSVFKVPLSIILCFLLSHPAMAQSDDEMCALYDKLQEEQGSFDSPLLRKDYLCRSGYWGRIIPKSVDAILTKKSKQAYDLALKEKRCSAAIDILANGFAKSHPTFPSIISDKKNYKWWLELTVIRFYPDAGLCFQLEKIEKSQKELREKGIKAKPFRGYHETLAGEKMRALSDAERVRHLAVLNIFGHASQGYAPELRLALLKLSLDGRAVKFHQDYEHYLAFGLKLQGIENSAIDAVLQRDVLDDKHRRDLEQVATKDIQNLGSAVSEERLPSDNADLDFDFRVFP